MFIHKGRGVFVVCSAAVLLSSCGGGRSSSTSSPAPSSRASIFTIRTDAPLPSVVSFQIMVAGITIFNVEQLSS
jgi:hypothetical protein